MSGLIVGSGGPSTKNFLNALLITGLPGLLYAILIALGNTAFVLSIQNTHVAKTLIMIALAPMISAILGSVFLKEIPDKKTITAIIITFIACIYIFHDSIKIGNFFGDFFGFVTALGLACNAILARYAKDRDLVPSAVIGKLCVAIFAYFFVENFQLLGKDLFFIPLMCVMCVAIPFVLVTIAPRFITAAEVNLFFLLETILGPIWVWKTIENMEAEAKVAN